MKRLLFIALLVVLWSTGPVLAQNVSEEESRVVELFQGGQTDQAIAAYRDLVAQHPQDLTIRERMLIRFLKHAGPETFAQERAALKRDFQKLKALDLPVAHSEIYLQELFSVDQDKYRVNAFTFYPQGEDKVVTNFYLFFVTRTEDGKKLGYLLMASNAKETQSLREMGEIAAPTASYYLRHYLPTAPDGSNTSGLIQLFHLDQPPEYKVALEAVLNYLYGRTGIQSGSTIHPDGNVEIFMSERSFLE